MSGPADDVPDHENPDSTHEIGVKTVVHSYDGTNVLCKNNKDLKYEPPIQEQLPWYPKSFHPSDPSYSAPEYPAEHAASARNSASRENLTTSACLGRDNMVVDDYAVQSFESHISTRDSGGFVTVGNSSIFVSGVKALELGLEVIEKISGYAAQVMALANHKILGMNSINP
ncbi:hypothetical protein GIB67_023664 [Kingdonia uniflora]|uniref:Uncharacterized protein n=1 Tax=Kingdonia uniflora TaxID=39325 RepID=A0A7J7MGA1_9MAGN|nr:hypothetical protein GIB67_023664 [Kingdonia uniflora]